MDFITDVESPHKCPYEQCQCQISSAQEYCSDYCEAVDDVEEAELQCNCAHASCALD